MNKVVRSADEAVADIASGSTVMLGGFGLCGIPENLIAALVRRRVTGLHTISNNMGVDGFGMGLMLEAGMIASHIGSYVGENRRLETLVLKGELDLMLIPQGTLAERMRSMRARRSQDEETLLNATSFAAASVCCWNLSTQIGASASTTAVCAR